MITEFYQIFGQLVFLAGVCLLLMLAASLFLGRLLLKEDRLIFPKLLLITVDMFYGPFKKFSESLGLNSRIVDQIGVEVRNKINEKRFKSIPPEDKALILPHCLRNPHCEARLERVGLVCTGCNRCIIGKLKERAEGIGYRVFIIPGSTFIKNILEEHRFRAVLGVACYQDLNLAMMKLSKFSPQGVPLLRDGCFKTKVDFRTVLEKMGVEAKVKRPRSCMSNPSRETPTE
ncbi:MULTISPECIES: DUF116 domain-containing protein [Methanothermobacter]|uniref:DUF116 domain-containing protein n=1 Tax=Methanothermobacter wolfeii TaxID=145261 RepID=A0A9E7RR70_METWO|nr:DUF116 domain-containing protein [Methanothermobacter wolfeii]NLM01944.1 DUF116 domain-containing protein [Methanothermobacter wolfeii]UXH30866.1 DUF116 domain-containing protein [Methanothermobacter wolfeii]